MRKNFAYRSLFALTLLVTVFLSVACGGPSPTSTPVPPTVQVPTALPPAPTAPPLTEAPTAVLPTQAPADTATPPPAAVTATTAAPAPTNTATRSVVRNTVSATRSPSGNPTVPPAPPAQTGPLQGLYVSAIRYDPTYPRNQEPLTFYVTIVNRGEREQNYPICVEIFRPGENKSFGISNCDTVNIPVGTHEVLAGKWTGTGIKECIPLRARAVLHEPDTDNVRLPLITLTGGELWRDFDICP